MSQNSSSASLFTSQIKNLSSSSLKSYGKIVDAWGQPPSSYFYQHLPEANHLFEKSGTSELLTFASSNPSWKMSPTELIQVMDNAGIDKMCK